jgi:hypothetical protein
MAGQVPALHTMQATPPPSREPLVLELPSIVRKNPFLSGLEIAMPQ